MRTVLLVPAGFIFLLINMVCTKTTADRPPNVGNEAVGETAATGTTVTYLIKQGAHYCTPNPLTFTSKSKISFTAVFDKSCIYKTVDPHNQLDINKLYGFSDCNTQHLQNSGRVGWRWSNDSLRLFGFVHNSGVIVSREITTVPIGSVITCTITCLATQYRFDVNGKTLFLPRHCSGTYRRYRLYPYFGGDEVAPHDITIKITEL